MSRNKAKQTTMFLMTLNLIDDTSSPPTHQFSMKISRKIVQKQSKTGRQHLTKQLVPKLSKTNRQEPSEPKCPYLTICKETKQNK